MAVIWGFGSRDLDVKDPEKFVFGVMEKHFERGDTLITGGARGKDKTKSVDFLMTLYVQYLYGDKAGDHVQIIEPDWTFKGAANARNIEIAKRCDKAIGIWNYAARTGVERNEVRNKDGTLNIALTMNKSGTWHSIVETIRKRKPAVLYVVLGFGKCARVYLKNDDIPDGSEHAIKKNG